MAEPIRTQCCIAGGGPAGMMLGYLLARSGVEVVVLEKHADFLRDFRGDTIHPSTLEVMHELGLADELLRLPHQKARTLSGEVGRTKIQVADFTHLPVHHPFIAIMPQWDFLNFLAEKGRAFPGFKLLMRAEVTDVVTSDGEVVGVEARTPQGGLGVRADLVIGADGRHSTVRAKAGLEVKDIGAPMDVLWFALPGRESDGEETVGHFEADRIFIMINRGDHWQCGFVIAKGSIEKVHAAGLAAFRAEIADMAPFVADRLSAIASFDDVKLLTVGVDRLATWHKPGLLCIGDAAHTMSPIGGIGINLAIQDAVATANLLTAPLREHRLTESDLAALQRRREWPTRITQAGQVFVQKAVIARVLDRRSAGRRDRAPLRPPLFLRLLGRFPMLRRIPARLIGMGVRPEHVRTAPAP